MPGPVSRGRFVWYDLMTPDPDAATEFYTKVAEWGTTPWDGGNAEDGNPPYMMWTAGEKPIGGNMKLPEEAQARGAPPHWLAYVAVPDAEAVVEEIEAPGVGEFSWHELATTDFEGALSFYGEVFGWKKTELFDMGEMGTYQMFGPESEAEVSFGGMFNKPPEMDYPSHWLYYITVSDIDAAVGRVKELGGQILNGPMEVPDGDMVAQCMDPQGSAFALHAKKATQE